MELQEIALDRESGDKGCIDEALQGVPADMGVILGAGNVREVACQQAVDGFP